MIKQTSLIKKDILRKELLFDRKKSIDYRDTEINTDIVNKTKIVIDSIISNRKKPKDQNIVGIYYSLKGEPDLIKLSIILNSKIALPKIKGNKFYYVNYLLAAPMEQTTIKNLMQPANNNKILPNIIVAPALAYSLSGYRLGFGKAYYDKYINELEKKNANIVKIGVCFHECLLEYIPYESHDVLFDYIITEKIIIKL